MKRTMIRFHSLFLILLALLLCTTCVARLQQCLLPTRNQFDFKGALQRQVAAEARAKERQALLNDNHNLHVEKNELLNKQENEQPVVPGELRDTLQDELDKRRRRHQEKIQQQQQQEQEVKLKKQQQEQEEDKLKKKQQEAREHQAAAKKKQQEEARRKQQEARRQQQQEKQRQQQQQQQRQQQQNKNHKQDDCPYTVLNVGRDASQAEIKSAYRKLAIQHHPDKNPGNDESKEHFTRLVNAYEILGDPDRRVLHDEQDTFGQYQSRPHNYNSKAGFYSGNSVVSPLNATEFERLVKCKGPFVEEEECEPYMIHFYTPWCVHCKNMIQEWKRAASTMDGTETPLGFVKFAGINCETNKQLCQSLGIRSYPEIHLYAQDAKGQEHLEQFPSRRPRNVDNFIEFATKGIRLAHEATLQSIDAFVMEKNVTNAESVGLWVVMYEGKHCPQCASLKASLRRMSANIQGLANFGVLDCSVHPKVCQYQYVGSKYPVLKLYPYKGAKGTGETLVEAGADPLVLLPVVEKVIRMCLANIEAENGLMKTLLEEEEEYDEPEPPKPQYQYPEPERQQQRVLPAGVRANSNQRQYIGG